MKVRCIVKVIERSGFNICSNFQHFKGCSFLEELCSSGNNMYAALNVKI